jgi:multiple sugar transport system permease protein
LQDARGLDGERRGRGIDWLPYLFIMPSIVLLLFVMGYPFASGIYYSLRDGSLLESGSFVGIGNYLELATMPDFRHSLYFTAIFGFFSVAGSYLVGLGLALLLDKEVAAKGIFRAALLIPWVIPSIVTIVSWRWMISDQSGLVNMTLKQLGLGPIPFLSSGSGAMFSVILIKIWRSFPFMMISCLAALQAIDRTLYEAARIDGAGRWQSFWHITFPHLRTISIVMWILMTIWCFNDFETIYLLTQGGPSNATESLIILAYRYAFIKSDVGVGSSIAIVSLVILMALAVLLLRRQREVH